ncbi:hypothetical protein [Luteolibacter sp. AS25]|uniref:hypothetical protein n=1 Tax=Luteolibacter sp. AS25 TaxID=3135776 RepID=UPI00398AB19B
MPQPEPVAAPQPAQQPQPEPAHAPVPDKSPSVQEVPVSTARTASIPPRRGNPSGSDAPPERTIPVKTTGKKVSSGIIPAMIGLFFLILAGGAVVFYISKQMGKQVTPPNTAGSPEAQDIREANYIRIGWQEDAFNTLDQYVKGSNVDEKLPHVIESEGIRSKMEAFYGGVDFINDSDTPADSFSVQTLSEEDRRRGIFMLTYDQPPQFSLKDFFRPLATLEVQYGIDEADLLLSTMARVSNFAMEPVRVHAFFKRTDGKLFLDWEVYAQTKYRRFRNFVELPDPGQSEVFRVLIVEDVPDKGQGVAGARTYRLADPANVTDAARVNVPLDSETGRALSIINWRGTKQNSPTTRTATVELEWSDDQERPQLEIKRFICWEFLGLGGKEAPAAGSAQ